MGAANKGEELQAQPHCRVLQAPALSRALRPARARVVRACAAVRARCLDYIARPRHVGQEGLWNYLKNKALCAIGVCVNVSKTCYATIALDYTPSSIANP